MSKTADIKKMQANGEYDMYTVFGGYSIFYITKDYSVLCPKCANEHFVRTKNPAYPDWFIIKSALNCEDELFCDVCSKKIESMYGDD